MRNLKRILSAALAMAMSLSLAAVASAAVDFKDSDKINYDEAVAVMSTIGVLEGYNGEFDPAGSLTREQAAKIIAYMLLGDDASKLSVADSRYKDVAANRWSAGVIEYCSEIGILAGNGDGTYNPEGKLTGYEFAKMLLGALGYKADIEGFVGAAWTLNVTTYAHEVGLDAGIEDIKWGDAISREMAAQMALNAVKSPLVQYQTGTTVIINGEKVTFGTGDAYYVTSTIAKEQRISTEKLTNSNDYTVEFGERYFPKLEMKATTDAFERPAYNWVYDKTDIGTWVNSELLYEEYTEKVTGKELYDLLGKSVVADYTITVYEDGVKQPVSVANEIINTNKTRFTPSGRGVLTQVFVDKDAETVDVVSINTYMAIASADYNEKTETATFTIYGVNKVGGEFVQTKTTGEDKVSSVKVENDDINVENIVEDDHVLVTVAKGAIQTIETPDVVGDVTITSFTKGEKVVADGETYNYADAVEYNYEVLDDYDQNNMKEKTYNIYKDVYGNLIGIEYVTVADNYVFITGVDTNTSNLANKTWSANAIFLDGHDEVIEVKNNGAVTAGTQVNSWYTYTVSNGVYTLTQVDTSWETGDKVAQGLVDDATEISIDYKNPALQTNQANKPYVYGNNDTVYLTAELDKVNNDVVIKKASSVSTGIKNTSIVTYVGAADALAVNAPVANDLDYSAYVLFKSNGYIIGAVVVGEDAAVSKNLVYVNSTSPNLESYDSTADKWTWSREVISGGEKIELTETGAELEWLDNMTPYAWYIVSYDANNNVTKTELVNADKTNIEYVNSYDNGAINDAIRTGKETVLYEQDFPNVTALPKLIEQTLYMDNNAANGFFISEDVKVVLIQKNSGATTTTFDVGPAAIENAIQSLNANGATYTYELTAIIERGAAQTVIIRDTVNGGAGSGNQGGNVGVGEYFTYTANIYEYGMAAVSVIADRPDWLDANDTDALDYTFDIYVNGKFYESVNSASTTDIARNADKATTNWSNQLNNGFLFRPIKAGDVITIENFKFDFSDQTYFVEYVDQNGNVLFRGGDTTPNKTNDLSAADATIDAAGGDADFTISSTKYTIAGGATTYSTLNAYSDATKALVTNAATQNPGTSTATADDLMAGTWNASSSSRTYLEGYVRVQIDLSKLTKDTTLAVVLGSDLSADEKAAIGTGTPTAATMDKFGLVGFTNDNLKIVLSADDNLVAGNTVSVTPTVTGTTNANTYNIVVKTNAGDLTFNNVTGTATTQYLTVGSENITITDVVVSVAVPKLKIDSISVDGNKMTINFNVGVEDETGAALAVADFATATASGANDRQSDLVSVNHSDGSKTVVLTFDGNLAAGDGIDLSASKATNSAATTDKLGLAKIMVDANGTSATVS